MKKKIIIAIAFIFLMSITRVKAACSNAELNDLAEKFKVVYTEETDLIMVTDGEDETSPVDWAKEYAYYLTFSPYSDKLKVKVTNSLNKDEQIAEYKESQKTYVIGSYIHYNPKEYTIKVYGGEKSACPNELLKTTKITVPRFNNYSMYDYCKSNKSEEICSMMKDTTKVTPEEFKEIVNKSEEKKKIENMTPLEKFKYYGLRYGLFILIPILAISIYYAVKMAQYKKKVRNQ